MGKEDLGNHLPEPPTTKVVGFSLHRFRNLLSPRANTIVPTALHMLDYLL